MKNLLEKARVKTASQMYNGRLILNEMKENCGRVQTRRQFETL
jgi:hypothetical protein